MERRALACSVVTGLAFVLLALGIAWRPEPAGWERRLSAWSAHHDDLVGGAWKLGSMVVVGPGLVLAAGIGVVRRRPIAVVLAVVAFIAIAVAQLGVKPLVARPAGLVYGFPSGHAVGSAFVAVAVVAALWSSSPLVDRLLVGSGAAVALLCGAAAVTSQSHLITDVLGSWLWVASWSALAVLGALRARTWPSGKRL